MSKEDEVLTCFVVIAEWEYGILNTKGQIKQQEIRAQGELLLNRMSRIIESSPEINRTYGEIAAELRRAGTMIPQNDMCIAAVARVVGATVVTHDNHFREVKNLPLVDWTKDV
ncbi:MAG: PIN domain-containing protein [Chthonomonadaceae bacterium]|nr:PIN domain-containing protein [Chthonomonadaceae bacterium]